MSNGVPVRLSEKLVVRARAVAEAQDRSLTEQVEHWALLGKVVEDAIMAATVQRLKVRSHDEVLADRLAFAKTPQGQSKAAKLIHERNPVRHDINGTGTIRELRNGQKRAKKR